jgi:mannose-1-phosphate guanylyltransferase
MGLEHFYAVIMAGGGGTRLWPLSNFNKPKQMLALGGQRTLFQQAVDRLSGVFEPEHIFVITVEQQAEALINESPEIPRDNFLIEPSPRGTASVVGLGASVIALRDSKAVIAVLTADHHIGNTELFHRLLKASYQAAEEGHLVTLGIPPENPSTGYGYLQRGKPIAKFADIQAYEVLKYKEKPNLATAKKFIKSGDHDWNSGMFFWKVDVILQEIKAQMPTLFETLLQIRQTWGTEYGKKIFKELWENIQPQTIDYGIMENAHGVVELSAPNLKWSDVGSWDSMFEIFTPDENGNIILSESHIAESTSGSIITQNSTSGSIITQTSSPGTLISQPTTSGSIIYQSDPQRIIAPIGMKDMIIIDTPNALLICPRGDPQIIRDLVKEIEKQNKQGEL